MVATAAHPTATHTRVWSFPDEVAMDGGGVNPTHTAVANVIPAPRIAFKKTADCITVVAFTSGPMTVNVTPPPPATSLTSTMVIDAAPTPVPAASVDVNAFRNCAVNVA